MVYFPLKTNQQVYYDSVMRTDTLYAAFTHRRVDCLLLPQFLGVNLGDHHFRTLRRLQPDVGGNTTFKYRGGGADLTLYP